MAPEPRRTGRVSRLPPIPAVYATPAAAPPRPAKKAAPVSTPQADDSASDPVQASATLEKPATKSKPVIPSKAAKKAAPLSTVQTDDSTPTPVQASGTLKKPTTQNKPAKPSKPTMTVTPRRSARVPRLKAEPKAPKASAAPARPEKVKAKRRKRFDMAKLDRETHHILPEEAWLGDEYTKRLPLTAYNLRYKPQEAGWGTGAFRMDGPNLQGDDKPKTPEANDVPPAPRAGRMRQMLEAEKLPIDIDRQKVEDLTLTLVADGKREMPFSTDPGFLDGYIAEHSVLQEKRVAKAWQLRRHGLVTGPGQWNLKLEPIMALPDVVYPRQAKLIKAAEKLIVDYEYESSTDEDEDFGLPPLKSRSKVPREGRLRKLKEEMAKLEMPVQNPKPKAPTLPKTATKRKAAGAGQGDGEPAAKRVHFEKRVTRASKKADVAVNEDEAPAPTATPVVIEKRTTRASKRKADEDANDSTEPAAKRRKANGIPVVSEQVPEQVFDPTNTLQEPAPELAQPEKLLQGVLQSTTDEVANDNPAPEPKRPRATFLERPQLADPTATPQEGEPQEYDGPSRDFAKARQDPTHPNFGMTFKAALDLAMVQDSLRQRPNVERDPMRGEAFLKSLERAVDQEEKRFKAGKEDDEATLLANFQDDLVGPTPAPAPVETSKQWVFWKPPQSQMAPPPAPVAPRKSQRLRAKQPAPTPQSALQGVVASRLAQIPISTSRELVLYEAEKRLKRSSFLRKVEEVLSHSPDSFRKSSVFQEAKTSILWRTRMLQWESEKRKASLLREEHKEHAPIDYLTRGTEKGGFYANQDYSEREKHMLKYFMKAGKGITWTTIDYNAWVQKSNPSRRIRGPMALQKLANEILEKEGNFDVTLSVGL